MFGVGRYIRASALNIPENGVRCCLCSDFKVKLWWIHMIKLLWKRINMAIYGSRCLFGEYLINRTLVIITHLLWMLTCISKWTGVQKYACVRRQCACIKLLDVYVWGWISLLCAPDMLYYLEYGMCEKLFGSLLSKGLSQSALCDV